MRKGLSVLSLVLGLMALMAATAQAGWLVEGKALGADEKVEVGPHTPGLLSVPGLNLDIECTELQAEDLLLKAGTAEATGKVKFTQCVTYSPTGSKTVQNNCKPVEPIVAGGKAHIVLHPKEEKNFVLFNPREGLKGNFSVVKFPEVCALVEDSEVTGSLVAECGTLTHLEGPPLVWHWTLLDCDHSRPIQLIRPVSPELFPEDALKFGEKSATLKGIAEVELAGVNAGKNWAGHI